MTPAALDLTVSDVSDALSISADTVRRAIADGKLAARKVVPRPLNSKEWYYLIDRDDLYAWLVRSGWGERDARNALLPAERAVVVAGDPPDWDYRRDCGWPVRRVEDLTALGLALTRGGVWAVVFDLPRLGPAAATQAAWQMAASFVRPHRVALYGETVPPLAPDVFDVVLPRDAGGVAVLAALDRLQAYEGKKAAARPRQARKKSALT